MLLFQLLPWIGMLLYLLLCITAYRCWLRSRQRGFLLFAIAFFLLLLLPLLYQLLPLRGGRALVFPALLPPLHLLMLVAAGVLMFRGLLSLVQALPPPPAAAEQPHPWLQQPHPWLQSPHARPQQTLSWPEHWRQIRRSFFTVIGLGLLLIVPPMAIFGGSGGGVAIVAVATGLACLWLGLHGGSPLVKRPIDAPRSTGDPQPAHALQPDDLQSAHALQPDDAQPPNPL